MTVKLCVAAIVQYIKVFQMSACYRDRSFVVVNYALEKYLLEEADVASYAKIFSSHCVQAKATAHSQFSSFHALF